MELFLKILFFFCATTAVFVTVSLYLTKIRKAINKEHEDEQQKLLDNAIKHITDNVLIIKEEKHGDIFYWFDEPTDKFLAQGKTFEELTKALLLARPAAIFAVAEDILMQHGITAQDVKDIQNKLVGQ